MAKGIQQQLTYLSNIIIQPATFFIATAVAVFGK